MDLIETLGLIDIDMKEIESGNRPLKMYLAIGYCSLTYQANTSNSKTDDVEFMLKGSPSTTNVKQIFEEAIDVADYSKKTNDRAHYYAYQSNSGKEDWAEGPFYFEFALREILATEEISCG